MIVVGQHLVRLLDLSGPEHQLPIHMKGKTGASIQAATFTWFSDVQCCIIVLQGLIAGRA